MEQLNAVEQIPRPYGDLSIEDLFEEITWNADQAHGLLNFMMHGLDTDTKGTIAVSDVRAFVESLHERVANVVDGLPPTVYELKIREREWQTGQANVLPLRTKVDPC